jgi:hypothetical protein
MPISSISLPGSFSASSDFSRLRSRLPLMRRHSHCTTGLFRRMCLTICYQNLERHLPSHKLGVAGPQNRILRCLRLIEGGGFRAKKDVVFGELCSPRIPLRQLIAKSVSDSVMIVFSTLWDRCFFLLLGWRVFPERL